jgi:tetratricopeptide (TPR) repeat protein
MSDEQRKLFVAMPYGRRQGLVDYEDPSSLKEIHFDEVWKDIISPAIPDGFVAKRADELREPGLIDQLYNEWLLVADVVLADLTFGNPNVFYELGIRQALSQRGTVLIAQAGMRLPFDVRNQYVLRYDYFRAPSLHQFQRDLKEAIVNASKSQQRSPVHAYLPGLFVGRFNSDEHPEKLVTQLRARVAELETSLAQVMTQADIERLQRRVDAASDEVQLVTIHHQILVFPSPTLSLLESASMKLRKSGLIDHAIRLLELAHERFPDDSQVLRELGFCFRKRGPDYFQRAQVLFDQALAINEADPELHGMLGGMLKRISRFDEAYQHYQRALELVPNNLYALVNLGIINVMKGDSSAAAQFYDKVLRITEIPPANPQDYWHSLCRGEAGVFLGQEGIADRAYGTALELSPPVEDVRSAAEQLQCFLGKMFQPQLSTKIFKMLGTYIARKTPGSALKLTGGDIPAA